MALDDRLRRRDEAIRREQDGIKDDLAKALEVMVGVARGEQTVQRMGEFISLNYPEYRNLLPELMRILPPKE